MPSLLTPLEPIVVQTLQEVSKPIEVFQSRDVGPFEIAFLFSPWSCHAANYASYWQRAQTCLFLAVYLSECRTVLASTSLFAGYSIG